MDQTICEMAANAQAIVETIDIKAAQYRARICEQDAAWEEIVGLISQFVDLKIRIEKAGAVVPAIPKDEVLASFIHPWAIAVEKAPPGNFGRPV